MPQYSFGAGSLFGTPVGVANATPVQFGTLQSVSVDIDFTLKELYGQNQFPEVVARGQAKIQGKAKAGRIQGSVFNSLFFSGTSTTGQQLVALNEVAAVPASTPWTVTVANSTTFQADQGVVFAATGVPLVRVASAPTTGQYAVAAGVYTFAAADTGAGLLISYSYTSATGGTVTTISNQLQGVAPTFSMVLTTPFAGQTLTLSLNACTSSKLQLATKQGDFMQPEMDFMAYADASGTVGKISTQG
ncbi:hypothetical protein [Nitrospirillum amazonense]|uniref:hypothetical protein n=1 Tax=Nitrospirillum amazonense TaxID=28077 RepID=UPI002412B052|nr:hypothetical protein [Nitrospirillum amazonense]MDG3442443.1 hypothetical protein [Nitrospirillum amazonense]